VVPAESLIPYGYSHANAAITRCRTLSVEELFPESAKLGKASRAGMPWNYLSVITKIMRSQGANASSREIAQNAGPIPKGKYETGAPHDKTTQGLFAMGLTPLAEAITFGSSDFPIGGDDRRHDASQGGINLNPQLRHRI
jgi:hypothetical protein